MHDTLGRLLSGGMDLVVQNDSLAHESSGTIAVQNELLVNNEVLLRPALLPLQLFPGIAGLIRNIKIDNKE